MFDAFPRSTIAGREFFATEIWRSGFGAFRGILAEKRGADGTSTRRPDLFVRLLSPLRGLANTLDSSLPRARFHTISRCNLILLADKSDVGVALDGNSVLIYGARGLRTEPEERG